MAMILEYPVNQGNNKENPDKASKACFVGVSCYITLDVLLSGGGDALLLGFK